MPLLGRLDTRLIQCQIARLGRPSNRPNERIHILQDRRTVDILIVDRELSRGLVLLHFGLLGAAVDVHAHPFLVVLGHDLLHHGVKVAQEGVAADHEVGLGGEGLKDAREFDGDVAGADEDNLFGLLLELEEAVGGDAVLGAGDVLWDDRISACAARESSISQSIHHQ